MRIRGFLLGAVAALMAALFVPACPEPVEEPPVPVELEDAGDGPFVRRAMLLLWGRRPTSRAEADVLTAIAEQRGRDGLVRALSRSPEYRERWAGFLFDHLAVNRTGFRANPVCFGLRHHPEPTGSLTEGMSSRGPTQFVPGAPFTFADLVHDGLVADDLSPTFRAYLFAFLPWGLGPPNLAEAQSQRRNLARIFTSTYLGRDTDCLPCHNSESSVTGSPDPERDRTWEIPGLVEAALLGASAGRDFEDVATIFRRRGVVFGFQYGTDTALDPAVQRFDGCQAAEDRVSCGGCPCEEVVCDEDPACCLSAWHEGCQERCNELGGCRNPWPDGFDGCTPVLGADGEGCGGCGCEAQVCQDDPWCCEGEWDAYCAQRCADVSGCDASDLPPTPIPPWGLDPICGPYRPPDALLPEVSGASGYLGGDLGVDASVYDVESLLAGGEASLRADGLQLASDGTVPPDQALAWLLAVHLADAVWTEAFGAPLTLAHGFPRNQAQRDRLEALALRYVDNGSSLRELLVGIATDPLFNARQPAVAAEAYLWPPVLQPFSIENEDPVLQGNDRGDAVHRLPARVQMRAAAGALGWSAPEGFFADVADPVATFQAGIGAFVQDSSPGFSGLGFQSLLAWEAGTAHCRNVLRSSSANGCEARTEPGCEDCGCDVEQVCAVQDSCCFDGWDASCVAICAAVGGCPLDQQTLEPDWLDGAVQSAANNGEVVAALRERLFGDPRYSSEAEEAAFDALTGGLGGGPDDGAARAACAAMLSGPDFLLSGLPLSDEAAPRPALVLPGDSFAEHCERLSPQLFPALGMTCSEASLTVN